MQFFAVFEIHVISYSACFDCFSMQQWEGLIELLGSESKIAGGLDFLHKYECCGFLFFFFFWYLCYAPNSRGHD